MLFSQSLLIKHSRLSLKNKLLIDDTEEKTLKNEEHFLPSGLCLNSSREDIKDNLDANIQDENISPNFFAVKTESPNEVSSEIAEDKKELLILGLPNCGNTCYANSVLQVLRYTPSFVEFLHILLAAENVMIQASSGIEQDHDVDLLKGLHSLYISMNKQESNLIESLEKSTCYNNLIQPTEIFISFLRKKSSQFKENQQHDAHEFLLSIFSSYISLSEKLEKIIFNFQNDKKRSENYNIGFLTLKHQDSLNKLKKKKRRRKSKTLLFTHLKKKVKKDNEMNLPVINPSAFLNEFVINQSNDWLKLLFQGKLYNIIKCFECENRFTEEQLFLYLQVTIPEISRGYRQESISLTDCLSHVTITKDEDKYFCKICQHATEARLSSEIISSPSVLLLHLSCLSNSSKITDSNKMKARIIIPYNLDTSEDGEIFSHIPNQNYDLYALIFHIGTSLLNGHYLSFIKVTNSHSEITKNSALEQPENCCMNMGLINAELQFEGKSSWLLFDDEVVKPIFLENEDIFPYFDYLHESATPCMIFYKKS